MIIVTYKDIKPVVDTILKEIFKNFYWVLIVIGTFIAVAIIKVLVSFAYKKCKKRKNRTKNDTSHKTFN